MSDAFQRWQDKTIDALGAVSGMLLTVSLGALAFIMTTIDFKKDQITPEAALAIKIALVAFGLSAWLGLMVMSSRLADFRFTMRVARLRSKLPGSRAELERFRKKARSAGSRTWIYLYAQLFIFGLGVSGLVVHILLIYSNVLLK